MTYQEAKKIAWAGEGLAIENQGGGNWSVVPSRPCTEAPCFGSHYSSDNGLGWRDAYNAAK